MKNKMNEPKKNLRGVLKERHVNRLIVKPLSDLVKGRTDKCLWQGEKLLKGIQGIDDSVTIIARQIDRWLKRGE
jgi:hypothetical protein